MIIKRRLGIPVFAVLLGLVTACAESPYVHNAGEFNRDAETFRTGIVDREEVIICHSRRRTQNPEILKLATAECQRFGKRAVFTERSLQFCPLVSPFATRFRCLAPGEQASNVTR